MAGWYSPSSAWKIIGRRGGPTPPAPSTSISIWGSRTWTRPRRVSSSSVPHCSMPVARNAAGVSSPIQPVTRSAWSATNQGHQQVRLAQFPSHCWLGAESTLASAVCAVPATGRSSAARDARRVVGGFLWLPRAVGRQPARVLDDSVDHQVRLTARPGGGHLARALADQGGEDRGQEPVGRGVGEPQQGIVLGDPLTPALAPHDLETRGAVARQEQQREVSPQPATLQVRPRAHREQLGGVVDSGPLGGGDRFARGLLERLLVLLPEGQEQLALPAEMVVQAADARPGPLDHVGDAGLRKALLDEHLARGVQERALGLRGTPPLPGTAGRPAGWLLRHLAITVPVPRPPSPDCPGTMARAGRPSVFSAQRALLAPARRLF